MLKKTITYTDYNGDERTEDFYFNLNKAELIEMQLSKVGGLARMLERIIDAKDMPALSKAFKDIILKAYGEKSIDGKRFVKSEELSIAFSQTEAYNVMYVEFMTDNGASFVDFVNAVIPADMKEQIEAKTDGPKATN